MIDRKRKLFYRTRSRVISSLSEQESCKIQQQAGVVMKYNNDIHNVTNVWNFIPREEDISSTIEILNRRKRYI